MVDKEITKKPSRRKLDKHDDDAGTRFETLECRLRDFIEKLNVMNSEIAEIKKQQTELLSLLRKTIK